MKDRRITPTQQEKLMRANDFIVSKTDTRGRITYGNRIFIEFSGYSETQLLGSQHNIIRHPDMPRGVFKFLWDSLAAEKEVFAFVKNLARDGAFYWVFANVTPSYDEQGKVNGYFSVRRQPNRAAVATISGLYAQMLAEEKKAGPKAACEASLNLLVNFLNQQSTSYEELVLTLQC
ncbi:MAG: PAS domain S-box protein [Gammaproteobacteria bacterium]